MDELKNDDNILAILALLSCAFALAENEETYLRVPEEENYVLYFRSGILLFSLASIFWIIRRYQMLLALEVLKYRVRTTDTLKSSGLYKVMLLEIAIFSIFSPPSLDYYFEVESLGYKITYSIDDILTFFTMLRLYTLLRLFGHHSIYTQSKAETICERNGEKASTLFALKSVLKDSPFIGIAIVFLSLATFSAVCMRIAERGVEDSSLESLADNMWVIFFTTTTVGYGNIYPVTNIGRLVCIFACIFGNMYLGMLVLAIQQKMEHSDNENLAFAWIYRKYTRKEIIKHATGAIRRAVTLYLLGKKWGSRTISKIKPNPLVEINGKVFKFDMKYLTESQFLKKKYDIQRNERLH